MPKAVMKEKTVPLEQLARETPEKISKTLGTEYEKSMKKFIAGIAEEARNMMKTKNDPESLRELANAIENSRHLEATITELRYFPRNIPKKYQEMIKKLLAKAEELTPSEILRGMADMAEEAEGEIRFVPKISIKPNQALVKELVNSKKEFVEDVTKIVTAGLTGKVVAEPFAIEFDDEKTAVLFFTALKEIGLEKPESEGRIAFKDATVPKGKYPIQVELTGKKVAISWPDWLAVGRGYLANMVPQKANPR